MIVKNPLSRRWYIVKNVNEQKKQSMKRLEKNTEFPAKISDLKCADCKQRATQFYLQDNKFYCPKCWNNKKSNG